MEDVSGSETGRLRHACEFTSPSAAPLVGGGAVDIVLLAVLRRVEGLVTEDVLPGGSEVTLDDLCCFAVVVTGAAVCARWRRDVALATSVAPRHRRSLLWKSKPGLDPSPLAGAGLCSGPSYLQPSRGPRTWGSSPWAGWSLRRHEAEPLEETAPGGSSAAEPVRLVDSSPQVAPAAQVALKVTMSRKRTVSVCQVDIVKRHVSLLGKAGLHTFHHDLKHKAVGTWPTDEGDVINGYVSCFSPHGSLQYHLVDFLQGHVALHQQPLVPLVS
ncbi:hypothetical protein EYF80_034334 [Liparis tanakae]|uniref:Uncharacterized protein n=1 Tax=Liparis tanakae TaxID=230148 RepID=A0A4Z2GRW5_9TELE|nr:hypothetical protein EYF80_034334 [Liparis tanakae]